MLRLRLAVAVLVVCIPAPVSLAKNSLTIHSIQSGIASVYTASSGPKTANGERVRSGALTAAHRTLPFGTQVRVTNVSNGRSVVVRVNDRGPFVRGRIIDLTPAGAQALGFSGIARVTLEISR
jgi:rare lipoprotein A